MSEWRQSNAEFWRDFDDAVTRERIKDQNRADEAVRQMNENRVRLPAWLWFLIIVLITILVIKFFWWILAITMMVMICGGIFNDYRCKR
jgi:hypothetical protein